MHGRQIIGAGSGAGDDGAVCQFGESQSAGARLSRGGRMVRHIGRRLPGLAGLLLLLLASCRTSPPPVAHEVYVWQRQWDAAVVAAVSADTGQFSGLRVLGLQVQAEQWTEIQPDLALLARDRRPLRLVVRIEGSRPLLDPALAAARIAARVQIWRAAGIHLAGVEIDHDCASARLAEYAQWLDGLRPRLDPALRLSITALPTWIQSAELPALLDRVDDSVLQVHAVNASGRALIDPQQALAWAQRYGRHSPRPFWLALPAYSLRVDRDAAGRVRAVAAEGEFDRMTASAQELRADPRAVADLLRTLARAPPAHLAGVIWFRLPLAQDRRSWSPATLAAVIAGHGLHAQFAVIASAGGEGLSELLLQNRGNLDAPPPSRIRLPAACTLADGIGGYAVEREGAALVMVRDAASWLRAGEGLRLGWARCGQDLQTWSIEVDEEAR